MKARTKSWLGLAWSLACIGACIPFLVSQACSPAANRQAINTALDVAQMACVLAHASMPDEAAIAEVCAIDKALTPMVKDLVGASRVAGLKPDAGKCP